MITIQNIALAMLLCECVCHSLAAMSVMNLTLKQALNRKPIGVAVGLTVILRTMARVCANIYSIHQNPREIIFFNALAGALSTLTFALIDIKMLRFAHVISQKTKKLGKKFAIGKYGNKIAAAIAIIVLPLSLLAMVAALIGRVGVFISFGSLGGFILIVFSVVVGKKVSKSVGSIPKSSPAGVYIKNEGRKINIIIKLLPVIFLIAVIPSALTIVTSIHFAGRSFYPLVYVGLRLTNGIHFLIVNYLFHLYFGHFSDRQQSGTVHPSGRSNLLVSTNHN